MEVLRTAFQTSLVLEWGGAVAVALVAVEISLRLMDGAIAFDRALAVLIIVPEFFLPLRQLATRYHSGAAGRAVAARAFAILDEPLPASHRGRVEPGEGVGVPVASDRHGGPSGLAITFRDVSFTYPGRIEPAVRALDLEIPAGRLTALVGASGAGKSTIASLLLRFIEPDSGRIQVGDTDLDAIDRERLAGAGRLGAAAPAPVPWQRRRQHPAGPARTRPTPPSGPPPARRVRTTSSRPSRTATTRPSASAGSG